VAMNNVAMPRLLVLSAYLDAMPQAVAYSLEDARMLRAALQDHVNAGVPDGNLPPGVADAVENALADTLVRVEQHEQWLDEMDRLLNQPGDFDMRQMTAWEGEDGRLGDIWQAIYALDDISRVSVQELPVMAQLYARDIAHANLGHEDAGAFVLPVGATANVDLPEETSDLGDFTEFRSWADRGLSREMVQADRNNQAMDRLQRGPYDTVFGRVALHPPRPTRSNRVAGRVGAGSGVPAFRDYEIPTTDTGSGGGGTAPPFEPEGYRVVGPFSQMGERVRHFSHTRLPFSRFGWYVAGNGEAREPSYTRDRNPYTGAREDLDRTTNRADFSEVKWGYLWDSGGAGPDPVVQQALAPDWHDEHREANLSFESVYDNAVSLTNQLQASGTSAEQEQQLRDALDDLLLPVQQTWFLVVQIDSRYNGVQNPEAPGPENGWRFYVRSYNADPDGPIFGEDPVGRLHREPGFLYPGGTPDQPASIPHWSLEPTDEGRVWHDLIDLEAIADASPQLQLNADPRIGYDPEDPNHELHQFNFIFYVGMNFGEAEPITNPYEGIDFNALPGPLGFAGDPDADGDQRPDRLRLLAVVHHPQGTTLWPERFGGGRPASHNVAIAQAYVFNNHSWDLWTQMWQAQLQPVDQYDGWIDLMESQSAEAQALPEPARPERYEDLLQYLRAAAPLAHEALSH